MFGIDKLFIPFLVGAVCLLALAAAVYLRARYLRRAHARELQAQGYRLIHALRAYSAWIEYQSGLSFEAHSREELALPEPLAQACSITGQWFPGLSQHLGRLLQAHGRVIEHLWRQHQLRQVREAAGQRARPDRQYQQLRGAQEDLVDEMIALCREIIGDAREPWRGTGSDFSFSGSGLGGPRTGPASQA